jgi:hypothetical protein
MLILKKEEVTEKYRKIQITSFTISSFPWIMLRQLSEAGWDGQDMAYVGGTRIHTKFLLENIKQKMPLQKPVF